MGKAGRRGSCDEKKHQFLPFVSSIKSHLEGRRRKCAIVQSSFDIYRTQ